MSSTFTKTPGWLDWDPAAVGRRRSPCPRARSTRTATCSGPATSFPFAPERKYTPCDAGKEQLFALRDHLGVSRNVIVQATCHGADNRAMVDAVRAPRRPGPRGGDGPAGRHRRRARARSTRQACGACGSTSSDGWSTRRPPTSWRRSPTRIAPLGWHVVVYFEAADLPGAGGLLRRAARRRSWSTTWAAPTSRSRVDGPEFGRFLRFVERNDVWVKVSCPERLTRHRPARRRRRAERLHRRRALRPPRRARSSRDRVLWGTDWPHPNLTDHMPDDGLLVDHVPHIAVTRRTAPEAPGRQPDAPLLARRTPLTRPPPPKEPGHAASQCGEPARPVARSPVSTRSCWSRCRSRTSSSSPTSTASPPRRPS